MIAFLLLCLVPALFLFATAPAVLFALMAETARERATLPASVEAPEWELAPPSAGRLQAQWA